jgi:hypothetical protein
MLKLSARKLHTILFLNYFLLKKHIFLSVKFGDTSADKSLEKKKRGPQTGKSAEHGGHVTRPGSHRSDGPRGVTDGDHRSIFSRTSKVSGCDL